ncbi:hypothetical protein QM467_00300 [Rhodoblastus sp. 17X3]|uniref:hypothetical protein n=1 Tax=Rhodoblastus sp. 17X3 TaxID=3047026 RepID=UPI0024B84FA7|nr:hypothetical protein [Rhodoblastus sp. 17X3]MDI9846491.1 hypothetical protein [Rhodoblastus sp. 17X3]
MINRMTHAYVIQIAGRTAGIVARDHADQAFRFFASNQTFLPLEGVLFDEPEYAERAARRLFKARGALGRLSIDDLTAFGGAVVAARGGRAISAH